MSPPEAATGASDSTMVTLLSLERLGREVEVALAEDRTDVLPPEVVQAMFAIACRVYSAQNDAEKVYLPLDANSRVTATDVMMAASGLLKAANLQVFELGMWVSYTGR